MTISQRKPDLWSDIQVGDNLRFLPWGDYPGPLWEDADEVTQDDQGRVIVRGSSGRDIVEQASYEMRLNARFLTDELVAAGAIDAGPMVKVVVNFSWGDGIPPIISVEMFGAGAWHLEQDQYSGDLVLRLFVPQKNVKRVSSPLNQHEAPHSILDPKDAHVARFDATRGEFVSVEAHELVLLGDGQVAGFGDRVPFDEVYVRKPYSSQLSPNPRTVGEQLIGIATWIHQHPERVMDPAFERCKEVRI